MNKLLNVSKMKRIVFLIFIFSKISLYSQSIGFSNVRSKDSMEVIKAWKQFIIPVQAKDTSGFDNISAQIIILTKYYGEDSAYKFEYARDSVRNILFTNLFSSSIINSYYNNAFSLSFYTTKDLDKYKLGSTKRKKYKVFEMSFQNNKNSKLNFGIGSTFDFIKVDNDFYFVGLSVKCY